MEITSTNKWFSGFSLETKKLRLKIVAQGDTVQGNCIID